MTTLTEWLNDPNPYGDYEAAEQAMHNVLRQLATEHRPIHPVFNVPKNDTVQQKIREDFHWGFDHPEDFIEQEAEWVECATCPDTADWPCPPIRTICDVLGCEPDQIQEDE